MFNYRVENFAFKDNFESVNQVTTIEFPIINKVTRSGHFIKNRISQNSNSLTDTYSYSQTGQLGVLQNVLSTDGFETAKQEFASDSIGFRKFGVAPTLAVLTPTPINNLTGNKETDKETYYSSWKNRNEIPMQKYVWNGRGQLAGVFAASLPSDDKKPLITHELLNYRMSDESGGQLAEFDGVALENNTNENVTNHSNNNAFIHPSKLARFVSVGSGISFERDELHINIDLGSFATLRLITRYPTLNASSPETLKSSFMQSRKELVVKDLVGSVSQVIDLESKKIVERNSSEPFGLSRGIPLLTNAVLADYKAQGARADVSLYSNPNSNKRANWQAKSFEVLGDHPQELQGLRGTVQYAQGKFSAATGMHSMGVRAYDPARGVWLSADIYIGQNLELQFNSADEANLYQYSGNNPVVASDPSGQNLFTKALKISFSRDPLGALVGFVSSIEGNYRRITSEDSSLAMRLYGAVCIVNDTLSPVPIDCDDIDYISQSLYEFANSFNYSNITSETSFEAPIAKSSSLIGDMPVNNVKAVSEKVQKHHIATDKKKTATANTKAWSPEFEKIFNKAGMSLKNDPANLVDIPGHSGRHSEEYHSTVFKRINDATEQCKPGPDFAKALRGELSKLAKELVTRDSELNQMVRRVGPYARQDKGSGGSRTNYSQSGRSFREIQRDRNTDRGKH